MKNKQIGIIINSELTLKEILMTVAECAALVVALWLFYLWLPG